MPGRSTHSVAPCFARSRLCFVLLLGAANTSVAHAAWGREDNSRPHVKFTAKPAATSADKIASVLAKEAFRTASHSTRPSKPPSYTSGERISGRRPPQNDRGHRVQRLGNVFEQGTNEAETVLYNKRAKTPTKSGRAPGSNSSAFTFGNEHQNAPHDSVRSGKRTAELKQMFEKDTDSTVGDRRALRTKGRENQKIREEMRSTAEVTNFWKNTGGQKKRKSRRGGPLSTEDYFDSGEEGPRRADPTYFGEQTPRSNRLPSDLQCVAPAPTPQTCPRTRTEEPVYENLKRPPLLKKPAAPAVPPRVKGGCQTRQTALEATPLHRREASPPEWQSRVSSGDECETIYDEVEAANYRVQELQSPRRLPSTKRSRSRRTDGQGRRVSRRKPGSSAVRSLRTFLHVFSFAYVPVALPLLLAGFLGEDRLMTLAGIVLLSGGSILNMLSLLAIWCRRLPLTDIIPFTAHNFGLIFGLPSVLCYSLVSLSNICMITICTAVATGEVLSLIPGVATVTALTALIGVVMLIPAVRTCRLCRKCRQRRAVEDPESTAADTDEIGDQLFLDFEMVSPEAISGGCEVAENAPPASWLSRVTQFMRLSFYSTFVTVAGATLAIAVCLARNSDAGRSASVPYHTPPPFYRPDLGLPYTQRRDASPAKLTSLHVIGYVGLGYMLFAIGGVAFRFLRHCVRSRIQSESNASRQFTCVNYPLGLYPFILGFVLCAMGFIAIYIRATFQTGRVFVPVVHHGVTLLGLFVALAPTLWTTFQCLGGSLQRILRDHLLRERRAAEARATDDLTEYPQQDSPVPVEGQNTAALEMREECSSSEWEEDD